MIQQQPNNVLPFTRVAVYLHTSMHSSGSQAALLRRLLLMGVGRFMVIGGGGGGATFTTVGVAAVFVSGTSGRQFRPSRPSRPARYELEEPLLL